MQRTLDIILDRVYKNGEISTKLKRSTLKKLLLDTCTNTAFQSNNKFYEQINGVSMGGSIGPLLANIIMIEFENQVVRKLLANERIKFYTRFVDDTLLLIKNDDIEAIKIEFEKFDSNLKFTYDTFENENPHFLDIEITNNGLKVYRKDTFTGHYVNFSSFVPWLHRISWLRSLVYRSKRICDKQHFRTALKDIKKFAAWNGFPSRIRNKLVNRFANESPKVQADSSEIESTEKKTVYFELPYIGPKGEQMLKQFKKRIRKFLKPEADVHFKTFFKTTLLSTFTPTKDKTPTLSKSHVVYEVKCPGCNSNYIGKTDRTLYERTKEHAWTDKESALRNHLQNCAHIHHMYGILNMNNLFDDSTSQNPELPRVFLIESLRQNTRILSNDRNWNRLLYKESLFIERNDPTLNRGLKASRKLQLFR